MSALGWKLVYGGKTPPPGEVVRPDERLSWPRTIGLGTQHVVAMFGATFVFPVVMGLNPNLAILMSGVATVLFLLIVKGKIPSYLGTSASFVAAVAAIRAQGGNSAEVTGSILVAGLVIVVIGVIVHFAGGGLVEKVLPPAVSGAVVMLIGFNLAPVVASVYWPQDQWVGLITMVFLVIATVIFRGFWSRIAIFLGLVFGYGLSWVFDHTFGMINSVTGTSDTPVEHFRVDWSGVRSADWIGFPQKSLFAADGSETIAGWHAPSFNITFILLVLPAVIALVAENAGHVKAVSEMTGDNLDRYLGRAFIGDGLGTALSSAIGGSPTTTYAENIGVMAATKVYSTAAYWVAGAAAILLGLSPKVGAVIASIPPGVLGGVTVALYGLVGILGVHIWVTNKVDFSKPINQFTAAIALVVGIADFAWTIGDLSFGGIALGAISAVVVYHVMRLIGTWRGTVDVDSTPETTEPIDPNAVGSDDVVSGAEKDPDEELAGKQGS